LAIRLVGEAAEEEEQVMEVTLDVAAMQ